MTNIFLHQLVISQTTEALNPIDLILEAGWVVKVVMFLLIMASVISWAIIFTKYKILRKAAAENEQFAEAFWSAGSLEAASRICEAHPQAALTRVFQNGLQEFNQVAELNLDRQQTIELLESNVARSLEKSVLVETESLQKYHSFLANTASAAPFVGLFGTVWGIMNSFMSIGQTGASNLAVVAPGIAEALIATALGLFAAIPAVLAYNYFTSIVKSAARAMRHFNSDFLNVAKRSL